MIYSNMSYAEDVKGMGVLSYCFWRPFMPVRDSKTIPNIKRDSNPIFLSGNLPGQTCSFSTESSGNQRPLKYLSIRPVVQVMNVTEAVGTHCSGTRYNVIKG